VVTAEFVVVVTSCDICSVTAVAISVMVGAMPGAVLVAVASLMADVRVLHFV